MKLLLVWLAGIAIGLLWTWWTVREPMDPIGRGLTIIFGVLFSILWPFVLAYCVVMGGWTVVRSPEEIEP